MPSPTASRPAVVEKGDCMKAHLVSGFDGALKEGSTYYAACGSAVPNAVIKFFFDEDFRQLADALRSPRVCDKCFAARRCLPDGLIYGVASAKPTTEEIEELAVA